MTIRKCELGQKSAERRVRTGVTPEGVTYVIGEQVTMSALHAMHERLTSKIAARAATPNAQGTAASTQESADES